MTLKLILLAIALGAVSFVTWHYVHTIEENKRLTVQISAANSTIRKLDEKFEAELIITETTEDILNEIRNSPDGDDAPVAPVLDRVLDRLSNDR